MDNKTENKTSQNQENHTGKAWDLSKNESGTFQFKTYFTGSLSL